jgi:hypothetical protein
MSEQKVLGKRWTVALGLYQLILGGTLIYLLYELWPDSDKSNLVSSRRLHEEGRLILLALVCGGIGGFLHGIRSYSIFIGNQGLGKNWVWWYIMKAPQGGGLALIFYLLARIGMFTLSQGGEGVNQHGIAALCILAGLFSDIAIRKLRDIFNEMVKPSEEKLADQLGNKE